MISELLALDPYALFLAYVLILGVVLALAAAADVALNRRSPR